MAPGQVYSLCVKVGINTIRICDNIEWHLLMTFYSLIKKKFCSRNTISYCTVEISDVWSWNITIALMYNYKCPEDMEANTEYLFFSWFKKEKSRKIILSYD